MRLTAGRVESFLAKPDPAVSTVLLYGPDAGLVAERARRLARTVVEDLEDPFRVSELSADELREAPGRLVEEAQALCLMGGRRLVRVRDAVDGISPAVRDLLALPQQEGFVLLEAGELGGGSSLRRLIEAAAKAVALPCYREEGGKLETSVRELLAEHGLQVEPDAFAYLVANLGGDRAVTRAEIEKLALYLADAPGQRATLADVTAVVGDSSALGIEDAVQAAVLGETVRLDRALDRLLAEGEAPVRILRSTAAYLLRLLRLHGEVAGGSSAQAAVAALRPPLPPRVQEGMVKALQRWDGDALVGGLTLLQTAETRCKSTGMPEALICRAALARLGMLPKPPRPRPQGPPPRS
ncbi:DNA polymerase III subunit delta [Benzoatithermus flavus]|uniref:DNA-directed DNA polymerase n=1 Tax=Benzoatithermus flavus TaxID=3108223 RepID=A0ABU8XKW5_9PROT